LTGKLSKTVCGIFFKEMPLKEPRTEHEKSTRIMTFARINLSSGYPFSHNHQFCVLIDFLQFLVLENISMNMRINNIWIILMSFIENHSDFDLLHPELVFRALRDSPSLNIDLYESNSFYKS
jgi:hypothetical protein